MKRANGLAIPSIATLALVISACSGGPSARPQVGPSSGSSGSVGGPSGPIATASSGATSAAPGKTGIVALAQNQFLGFLDPASGLEVTRIDLAALFGPVTAAGPHFQSGWQCDGYRTPSAAALHLREEFDRDYTRVAVVDREHFPDESRHVGYIDIATGTFTDVTAMTTKSGFSAHVPIDVNPLFDPKANVFWFLRDTGEIIAVNLDTGTSEVRAQTPAGQTGSPATASFVVAPGSDQPVAGTGGSGTVRSCDDILPNPSGTVAAIDMELLNGTAQEIGLFTDFTDTLATSADDVAGNDVALAAKAAIVMVDGGPPPNSLGSGGPHCLPLAWVSDNTLVCDRRQGPGGPGDLALDKLAAGQGATTSTLLLPPSERQNYGPVISPDGSTIAFLSQQGSSVIADNVSLYTIAVDQPGSEPARVGDSLISGTLIDWR